MPISDQATDRAAIEEFFGSRKLDVTVESNNGSHPLKRFWLRLGPKCTLKRLESFKDELGLTLRARSTIITPDFSSGLVRVDMMVADHPLVNFNELVESTQFNKWETLEGKFLLPVLAGVTDIKTPLIIDLAKFPHLLVAGTTGSGKSIFEHTIIQSLLLHAAKNRVRVVPFDPKYVEFSNYEKSPGLYYASPGVATEPEMIDERLMDLTNLMEERLKLLQRHKCRSLADYREKTGKGSYIVIVIDELADLMRKGDKRFERNLERLAAKSRAAGIHIVAATQYPHSDVITSTIKSNFDGRVCFKVTDQVHSRVMLDSGGAESLCGKGDGLLSGGGFFMKRFQGALAEPTVTEDETVFSRLKSKLISGTSKSID